jgi:uncharacterized YigZ family protein
MANTLDEDLYLTVEDKSQGLFRSKGSKFHAYCFPISDEIDVKKVVGALKTEHHKARHWCWAYRLNPDDPVERSNDDGEPGGTAGIPILNQLRSKELVDTAIVVVRYFGGTKLGVRGLIEAYGESASEAISHNKSKQKVRTKDISINFGYEIIGPIQQALHELKLEAIEKDYAESCTLKFKVPKSQVELTKKRLSAIYGLTLSE